MGCYKKFILVMLFPVLSAGCATVEPMPKSRVNYRRPGVYHKIGKDETLWRIAQTYDIPVAEISRSNNIPDAAFVEENQLIFIPGADRVRKVQIEEEVSDPQTFMWPIKGKVLFYYGHKNTNMKNGIGIAASEGQEVSAVRSGEVVFADYLSGYAHTLIIDHFDGYYSVYGNNAVLLAKVGESVKRGQAVSRVGSYGGSSYLYFELRRNHVPENPLFYLPK